MTSVTFKGIAMALSLVGSSMAMAANDGQNRVSEILSSSAEYRDTWQSVIKSEERCRIGSSICPGFRRSR